MITANTNRAQKSYSVPLHFHKINSANQHIERALDSQSDLLCFSSRPVRPTKAGRPSLPGRFEDNQGVKTLGQPTP